MTGSNGVEPLYHLVLDRCIQFDLNLADKTFDAGDKLRCHSLESLRVGLDVIFQQSQKAILYGVMFIVRAHKAPLSFITRSLKLPAKSLVGNFRAVSRALCAFPDPPPSFL